jgi:hypothetical protein
MKRDCFLAPGATKSKARRERDATVFLRVGNPPSCWPAHGCRYLFSLFSGEIISQRHLVLRRNPGLPAAYDAK